MGSLGRDAELLRMMITAWLIHNNIINPCSITGFIVINITEFYGLIALMHRGGLYINEVSRNENFYILFLV
jgi:hypothetical protein